MIVDGQRMVVAVAHPDDETFGCGSLIAYAAARGVEVTIVCATRGEAGSPAPGSGIDAADLAVVRADELHQAATMLGAHRVVLLSYRDSGMDGEPAPGTLCAGSLPGLVTELAALVDEVRPHVIVTLDGSDGHRDHVRMREAMLLAFKQSSWQVERVYLHCLPRRLMRQWVDRLHAKEPGSNYLHLGQLGTPDDELTTVIDTSALLDLRERAIAVHASQVSPYEVMEPDLRRAFLTAEHLLRVHPEPPPATLEQEMFAAPTSRS